MRVQSHTHMSVIRSDRTTVLFYNKMCDPTYRRQVRGTWTHTASVPRVLRDSAAAENPAELGIRRGIRKIPRNTTESSRIMSIPVFFCYFPRRLRGRVVLRTYVCVLPLRTAHIHAHDVHNVILHKNMVSVIRHIQLSNMGLVPKWSDK